MDVTSTLVERGGKFEDDFLRLKSCCFHGKLAPFPGETGFHV